MSRVPAPSKQLSPVDKLVTTSSVRSMSNSRWLQLFEKLDECGADRLRWKLLGMEQVIDAPLPHKSNLLPERLGDCLPAPYSRYRDIEWIEVTGLTRSTEEELVAWNKAIPWQKTDEGLRVIAYAWLPHPESSPLGARPSEA